jgi:hypothetical protein
MTKVFVKWSFTDDYGRACEEDAKLEWFDTEENAEAFVNKMKQGNGGYFKLWKIAMGDYHAYKRMIALYEEYLELKKNF